MQGKVAYRQLVLTSRGKKKLRLPLLTPINDVLGWSSRGTPSRDRDRGLEAPSKQPRNYSRYLMVRYGSLGFPVGSFSDTAADVAADFKKAATAAEKGRIDPAVAPYLERLRFAADGTVDVPDFAALVAWSLLEGVQRQELRYRKCRWCGRPWLAPAEEPSRYCQRWAPEHDKDCRTLAYERRLAGDKPYRDYRREYKRTTAMHLRGAIESLELDRWRDENSPTDWTPFEQWKEESDG
jgi:hypothetical protein